MLDQIGHIAALYKGPTGIMIPLGIENYVSLTTAYMFYNYIAIAILIFIAAMAGSRGASRFAVAVPIFAAMFTWFGWLNTMDQSAAASTRIWAVSIIAGILAVVMYMNEQNRERYGIGGPGSKLLNIVFFIILFQACIGLTTSFEIFPAGTFEAVPTQSNVAGMPYDSYHNIDVTQSFGNVASQGGLINDVVSVGAILTTVAFSALRLMVQIITSILLFSVVLNGVMNGIFPGITGNATYLTFLVVLQVGNWALLAVSAYNWYRGGYNPEASL